MDRKVILSRYAKAVYRSINSLTMYLVAIKDIGKSKRINDLEFAKQTSRFKSLILEALNNLITSVGAFIKWIDDVSRICGIENNKESDTFEFHRSVDGRPGDVVKVKLQNIVSVERHFSGRALIKYNENGEEKELITWEHFNRVIVQLGLDVEYKEGRYVTKIKPNNKTTVLELVDKLNGIYKESGDIELEAVFTTTKGDEEYKERCVGNIDKTVRFLKEKITKPEIPVKMNKSDMDLHTTVRMEHNPFLENCLI